MSTKQSVIFAFMVVFLAAMLFALGAWYYLDMELDSKNKMIDVLNARKQAAKIVLDGNTSGSIKGIKKIVDDPLEGLAAQFEKEKARATNMTGGDDSGMKQRQILYEQKEKELEKWPQASVKWKALYEEWLKLNGDIEGAVKKLKQQNAESDTKSVEAQIELARELEAESKEKATMNIERKKNSDDLGGIRANHESVMEKISEVTRETKKTTAILPQGKIIFAAEDLNSVTIDLGREHGVRKGTVFDVYSGALSGLVKKATIEVVTVKPSSSDCIILPPKEIFVHDPQTGWVPTDKRMRYSVYSAGGPDETAALELVKPKTREDRIKAYQLEKLEREQGIERVREMQKEKEEPSAPPVELGKGFVPIVAGDWVNNPDFSPLMPEPVYQKKTVDELLAMKDVNLSTLTFFITDSVRPYRKEFLKRLAERNRCRAVDTMSSDVNYVVTAAGLTRIDLLEEKLASTKGKEEVSAEIRDLRKTLEAMTEGRKIGTLFIAEDEIETFFLQRQRKAELLRGRTIQPGRSSFYVAGETKERSVAQTQMFIRDNGGVVIQELSEKVDYVVVGAGLDQKFYDEVKRLGIKILREDELPRYFGIK